MVTLPGAWRYRVSAGAGCSGVSILWLSEMESLICNFCLSVVACKIVWADSPWDILACCWGVKQPTNKQATVWIKCNTAQPLATKGGLVSHSDWVKAAVILVCLLTEAIHWWRREGIQSTHIKEMQMTTSFKHCPKPKSENSNRYSNSNSHSRNCNRCLSGKENVV